MRDPERIERTLELLRELWSQHPDQRLTQLLGNVGFGVLKGDLPLTTAYYNIEDDDLAAEIDRAVRDGFFIKPQPS